MMLQFRVLIAVFSAIWPIFMQRPPLEVSGVSDAFRQDEAGRSAELEIRISPTKSRVTLGDALSLRVEIWNVGTRNLFVCRDFLSGPCDLRLSFDPLAKVEHFGLAADCVPYELETHPPPSQKGDFAKTLVDDWIAISPSHFYGAAVELKPSWYPELKVPGHYRISARYSSGGLLEQHCYYKLRPFREDVTKLPAESWIGEIESNVVAVQVVPQKKLQ
jgi:hypothetical protein